MLEWAMAHPWMTLLIALLTLLVLEGAIANLCKTIIYIVTVLKGEDKEEKQ